MRKAFLTLLAAVAVLCTGCGAAQHDSVIKNSVGPTPSSPTTPSAPTLHAHPQAVEPIAGSAPAATAAPAGPTSVSVGPPSAGLPQPVSDAEVRKELAQSGLTGDPNQATMTPQGLAIAPINAPLVVQEVIDAGNQIAHLPYRFGGGHGTFIDNAYDCSGSLSFVFAAAGLLNTTMTSGQLESWGQPGPGKWITIFANAGHTFMYIAGLRFDTVALAETGTRWSNRSANEPDLSTFIIRHPTGL